jgi:hypothetical protein
LLIYPDGSLQFYITKFKVCSSYLYLSGIENVFFISILERSGFEDNQIRICKVGSTGTTPDFFIPVQIYNDFILFCKKVLTNDLVEIEKI